MILKSIEKTVRMRSQRAKRLTWVSQYWMTEKFSTSIKWRKEEKKIQLYTTYSKISARQMVIIVKDHQCNRIILISYKKEKKKLQLKRQSYSSPKQGLKKLRLIQNKPRTMNLIHVSRTMSRFHITFSKLKQRKLSTLKMSKR